MNDTDMLYMAAQEKELEKVKAENMKMKKLIGEIRSYYGEISPSWSDLFEEQAKALIEGGKP